MPKRDSSSYARIIRLLYFSGALAAFSGASLAIKLAYDLGFTGLGFLASLLGVKSDPQAREVLLAIFATSVAFCLLLLMLRKTASGDIGDQDPN